MWVEIPSRLFTVRPGDSGFTHTRVRRPRHQSGRNRARVMWHSPQTVSRPRRCESPGAQIQNRPLRIFEVGPGWVRRVARRRGPTARASGPAGMIARRLHGRGDPIGVVKLLRARGGCLGVIRIRAWKAAISPGELPNERRSRDARATQGTETSQYLEERKSTETPSVAASERGPAQTGWDTTRGRGAGVVEWAEPSRSPLENGTRAGDSPVGTGEALLSGTQVGSGT
jgi:hypothetical protein